MQPNEVDACAIARGRKALALDIPEKPARFAFVTISGAHIYGFPSPDSDIDLRGAHVNPLREVVGLKPGRETFEMKNVTIEGIEIDCVSHDLGKYLRLLIRKNGYALEQILSPLVVYDGGCLSELRELARGAMTRHLVHHYKGFFATQERLLLKLATPTAKAMLYLFRVAMTGIHVLLTGEVETNITKINEHFKLPFIADLVARKRAGAEKGALPQAEFEALFKAGKKLEARLDEAFAASSLPDEVRNIDAVDDFLVRTRLGEDATPGRTAR
jgi:predicted nucleotidyltransferase